MSVVIVDEHTEPKPADPAPLGLAAFALTTFLLTGHQASFIPDGIWVGCALFYGGLVQLLAGMWEFKNRNTFGATAFSTYGGFWLSIGAFVVLLTASPGFASLFTGGDVNNAEAWFLIAFAIFNSYMLLWSMRLNVAIFAVFLLLELAEILLAIGNFHLAHGGSPYMLHVGGWFGIATAAMAWYTSAALVANGMPDGPVLPVGKPIMRMRAAGAVR